MSLPSLISPVSFLNHPYLTFYVPNKIKYFMLFLCLWFYSLWLSCALQPVFLPSTLPFLPFIWLIPHLSNLRTEVLFESLKNWIKAGLLCSNSTLLMLLIISFYDQKMVIHLRKLIFFFLTILHNMKNLSSPTSNRTHAPGSESLGS